MIERIVRYRVKPDRVADAQQAIGEFVDAVAKSEEGTLSYRAYQYVDDPTEFVHTMAFADADAQTHHQRTDHVEAFVSRLYPLCFEQPEFRDMTTVADTDLVG